MADSLITQFARLTEVIPALKKSAHRAFWVDYDRGADVLYVNFKNPSIADDSELTDDGVIIRYSRGKIIGYTYLNASGRLTA